MSESTRHSAGKSQLDKFKELAEAVETDDSEDRFDDALRKIVKSPPSKDGKQDKDKPAK